MTFVEKYPFCWQSILQAEAQQMVLQIQNFYYKGPTDEYTIKVQLNPNIWECLNTHQQEYFTSLFGGDYFFAELKDNDGIWLCVHRFDILGFHYHAPLRVHPIRIHKSHKS